MERITVRPYEDEPLVPSNRIRRRMIRRRAALAGLLLLCVLPAQAVDAAEPHDAHHPSTGRWLYVSDYGNNRVVTLPTRGGGESVLVLDGLVRPTGLAWDRAGSLYIADTGNNRVLRL
ncbi:hypothetical protein ACFV17_33845, partial [Streptomyces sp. NPDC059656]